METRKRGRPPKAPEPGKRVSLGLKVTPQVKTRLDEQAKATGRTQSQEAERLLELALQFEDMRRDLDAMRAEAAAAVQAARIQAIRAAGFQLVREAGGGVTVNVSPELLLAEADGLQRSGFVGVDAAEQLAEQVAAKVLQGLAERQGRVGE